MSGRIKEEGGRRKRESESLDLISRFISFSLFTYCIALAGLISLKI